jgi:phosphoribosylglycinamide formyltransferase
MTRSLHIHSSHPQNPLPILTMAETCRILVMASGNGTNFQALCDGVTRGSIPNSSIIRLIVNRGKAYATQRAEQNGIPWEYFNLITHGFQAKNERDEKRLQEGRDRYDVALAGKILDCETKPHLIVLAGWMHVFGEQFLKPIRGKGIEIINLHPGLPGQFSQISILLRIY